MSKDGVIKISKDVILNIIGIASLEVEGVQKVIGFKPATAFQQAAINENKGISLNVSGTDLYVDLGITVKKDYEIPKICEEIQKSIIKEVKNMTDLNVKEVNIQVADIAG